MQAKQPRTASHGKRAGSQFKGHRHRGRPRQDEEPNTRDAVERQIFGLHAAEAVLSNPARTIHRILATENAEQKLGDAIAARGLRPERASPKQLEATLGRDTVHQGILLDVEPIETASLADATARCVKTELPLIVLDQVTDPHNVGAILRSAAVFGAAGLIMTRRHSPPLGGVLAKSASGALELMPVTLVQNLAKTLGELAENGIVTFGLDGTAAGLIEDELAAKASPSGIAFILGAEGRGLRQSTKEAANRLCRIGTAGPISSLNVSNAAAVALHLAAMRRRSND